MPNIDTSLTMNLFRAHRCFSLGFLLMSLCFASASHALQEQPGIAQEQKNPEKSEFIDNLGRDTPRSSFVGFLKTTENFDYQAAVQFMDLRNLPDSVSRMEPEELARQLDFIIKRGMKINVKNLSRKVSGQVVDGLPEYRDELGHLVADEEEQVLLMQRVPGLDENFIWKISNESVALIPELYDYFSYPDWVEYVRKRLPIDSSFQGIELFKWVILLGSTFISWPIFWLIGFALSWLISKPVSPLHRSIRRLFTLPIPFFFVMVINVALLKELGLGARAQSILESKTMLTVVFVWIVFSLIDLVRERRKLEFRAQGRRDAHILGRPLANALKLMTLLAATLIWLSNSGVEISALLAGLGIGGVALALALQKPIEDLLGAVSLYSQQPIQAGDFCKYGTTLGSIEEIGLRTTRIRTLNDTLVSIPNSLISQGAIENYSARKKMLYQPDLPLRYDTSQEQMQSIIDGIEAMARSHEKVIKDEVRIRFTDYTENAMIIKARIYVDESDFSGYLKVVGELNMSIKKIVQECGAHFAQGATTIMLENGGVAELQSTTTGL
jgi:MscS family membrane protein